MPWHKKRITAGAREDLKFIIEALEYNQGRGYFCHEHMPWACPVYTDAMKDSETAGWGWVSADGRFSDGIYGTSQKRKLIDVLEGDAVLRAARVCGKSWAGKRVPLHIDNSAFQLSFKKGRSKVERLNRILRQLYTLSVKYDCIFYPQWISTHDNIGADALSRGKLDEFWEWCNVSYPGVSFYRCG